MNLNIRVSQDKRVLNVKWIWTKELFRFVLSGTMNPEKGGLTYTFTHGGYCCLQHELSRSRWDLILD